MWWRERRWVGLLELIDGLPNASRLTQAQMNDPETAAEIAQMPSGGGRWRPEVREYDTTAVLLSRLLTATQDVARAIVASNGGKPGKGEPMPTPHTRVEDMRQHLLQAAAIDLINELGGG